MMVSILTEGVMPVQLFTAAERTWRNRFPEMIAYDDLITFFTLSERDMQSIPRYSAPHNRLGYALQLCTLRFMGFVPDDLTTAPSEAVAFVAQQLAVAPSALATYGARVHTRQDHLQAVQAHLGYRKPRAKDLQALADWVLERALEHDKPMLLYELTCEKLRTAQLLRPGVTRLERLVAEARVRAQTAT
jgi:TnpA family transposase